MAGWLTKRVLIAVRTYPAPTQKTIEASCTGGITDNGEWIRLFPVPYRLMDEEKRFRKWQWIEVDVVKAKDGRPESYKINIEKITPAEKVGTKDGWRARREIVKPLIRPSMCHIRRQQKKMGAPTLGLFKPGKIERLIIEPTTSEWSAKEQEILRTDTLFQKAPAQTLEKIPYNFKYEFRCVETTCSGHTMTCFDWEMLEAFRRWRRDYGDQWQEAFRQTFEQEMIEKNDTHFFVGTMHLHPGNWIIVGLFYPPHSSHGLFDVI